MTHDIRQMELEDFPTMLREIPDTPKKLFIQGSLPHPDVKLLAVVGSRKCTSYGRDVVEYLIRGLKEYNIAIVSGLALGIDGCAHKAALENNLPTIAIPGSGLSKEVLYPRSHVQLAHDILESGGALLSEFEPQQSAAPWTFPKRNRLMAGLAHATLVIEATQRSGTLITARLAVEYNRELLVVPGSIFASSSKGAHQFLKLGATPITEPEDILHVLGIKPNEHISNIDEKKFSENEQLIYDTLNEPRARDELLQNIPISASEANVILSKLELDGVIVERLGVLRRAQ